MLNLISENCGWMLVGSLATLCLILAGSMIIEIIKDRLTKTEESEENF
jgi:hypothetical protein